MVPLITLAAGTNFGFKGLRRRATFRISHQSAEQGFTVFAFFSVITSLYTVLISLYADYTFRQPESAPQLTFEQSPPVSFTVDKQWPEKHRHFKLASTYHLKSSSLQSFPLERSRRPWNLQRSTDAAFLE